MIFYTIAAIILIAGGIFSYYNPKIHWIEWVGGSVLAFIMAAIYHYCSFRSQTVDVQTFSGRITHGVHYAAWREKYREAVYKTQTYRSNGQIRTRRVFSHYATRYDWHPDRYVLYSTLDTSYSLSKESFYNYAQNTFGNIKTVKGKRSTSRDSSTMVDGDPNDYHTYCPQNIIEPVTTKREYENRLLATKTVYSFIKVPENFGGLYDWPENNDPFTSTRLLGNARNKISTKEWDILNAKLGPVLGINLILIEFDKPEMVEYQRAKWVGGKKNDLVLCYGNGWARVFGWTDSEICKKNLESILLNNPINDSIIPLIEAEVRATYKIKNWDDFNYLTVVPKTSHIVGFIVLIVVVQGLLYWFFHNNDMQ